MSSSDKNTSNPLQSLKDNWFIIVFFLGMAVTWGSFAQKDSVQEARIEILESKIEKVDSTIRGIGNTLVEINTTLKFIQEKLNKE